MAKISEPWSSRQQRHLAYISEFTTDIRHIQDKDNHVADALSRVTINPLHEGVDCTAMAACQQQDPSVQAYWTAITGLKLKDVPLGQLVPHCSVTSPPANLDLWFHLPGDASSSMWCTVYPTPLYELHTSSWRRSSSGTDFRNRWVPGPRPVLPAKHPKYSNTLEHHWDHSRLLSAVLTTYMSTSLAHFHLSRDIPIS